MTFYYDVSELVLKVFRGRIRTLFTTARAARADAMLAARHLPMYAYFGMAKSNVKPILHLFGSSCALRTAAEIAIFKMEVRAAADMPQHWDSVSIYCSGDWHMATVAPTAPASFAAFVVVAAVCRLSQPSGSQSGVAQ